MTLKPRVFVGMSGGVDSSVTAALLVEAGYSVTGVYMKNWSQDLPGARCPWAEDLADAKRVAVKLGIDLKVYDFETEYRQKVVDYMLAEYQAGRTPNPDVMCNQEVKFKLFLETALADGADLIATGHYAKVSINDIDEFSNTVRSRQGSDLNSSKYSAELASLKQSSNSLEKFKSNSGITQVLENSSTVLNNQINLVRAKDDKKDQTYFLYRVTKEALAKTLFPLGDLLKTEVRQMAKERGLVTAGKKDSVGICFVGQVGIEEFLGEYLDLQPGKIIELETNQELGWHKGAFLYTIGQRHGLEIGGGLPYYVVKKDTTENIVFVSKDLNRTELWVDELKLNNLSWINNSPEIGKTYQIRTRHLAPLLDAEVQKINQSELILKLQAPQRAVASGQSVVIYDKEICLGGGVVD